MFSDRISIMSENKEIFKSGFIAVMGRPNVGKSTLINSLLNQKVAAVSPRPQTTRKQQLGILSLDHAQLIFIDTPGIHEPHHQLGKKMNIEAQAALEHTDLILFVVDVSRSPDNEDRMLANILSRMDRSNDTLLVLNKVDQVTVDEIEAQRNAYLGILPSVASIGVSATDGLNFGTLLETMIDMLPEGIPFYPVDQVTDLYEREIAADLIREACLIYLRDEVPHGIAVRIDEYKERNEHGAYIEATIFVERDSHKGIVIGQNGSMAKKIGEYARHEIEEMSGRRIFLRLRVKVRKNWRNDERSLQRFGFSSG
jgi:GTP-binding protein Era